MNYLKYLILGALLTQCTADRQPIFVASEKFLDQVGIDSQLRHQTRLVIVIPNAGCPGCILNSEAFMFKHIDSADSTYFILTTFNSLKSLKLKYNAVRQNFLNHQRVIIDHNHSFAALPIDQKYPVAIQLRNGNIESVESFDVDNQDLLQKLGVK